MLDHIRKLQVIIDKIAKNMTTNDYLNAMNMLLEMYNVYQLKHIQMKPPTYVESDDGLGFIRIFATRQVVF